MRSKDEPKGRFGSTFLNAARREQFIGCAIDVLAELGFGGASMAAFIRGCTDFAWTHQKDTRALGEIFRNLRNDDGEPRYTAKDSDELIQAVADLLIAGQRSGEFGDFDARTLATLPRATIDALPRIFESDPAVHGPELAEHLVNIFNAATRPHAGPA